MTGFVSDGSFGNQMILIWGEIKSENASKLQVLTVSIRYLYGSGDELTRLRVGGSHLVWSWMFSIS